MGEVVLCFAVIGVLVWGLQVHQVEDVEGDCDEENFHYGLDDEGEWIDTEDDDYDDMIPD